MADDIEKAAELRGYSRGYQAGKRRRSRDHEAERHLAEDRAFWDRAFLAALPAVIASNGWTSGEKPVTTLEQRVDLARKFAAKALQERRLHRP